MNGTYKITDAGAGHLTLMIDGKAAYISEPRIDTNGKRYFYITGGKEWDASFNRIFRGTIAGLKKDFHDTAKRFNRIHEDLLK